MAREEREKQEPTREAPRRRICASSGLRERGCKDCEKLEKNGSEHNPPIPTAPGKTALKREKEDRVSAIQVFRYF